MIARHPHVFGEGEKLADARAVRDAWERRKLQAAQEGAAKIAPRRRHRRLAAGARRRLSTDPEGAGVGFDWPNAGQPSLAKLDEELAELRIELEAHATSPTEATKTASTTSSATSSSPSPTSRATSTSTPKPRSPGQPQVPPPLRPDRNRARRPRPQARRRHPRGDGRDLERGEARRIAVVETLDDAHRAIRVENQVSRQRVATSTTKPPPGTCTVRATSSFEPSTTARHPGAQATRSQRPMAWGQREPASA